MKYRNFGHGMLKILQLLREVMAWVYKHALVQSEIYSIVYRAVQ